MYKHMNQHDNLAERTQNSADRTMTTDERYYLKRDRRERGFVYFITDEIAIKIGFSTFVEARRAALESGPHLPLRLIAQFPGSPTDERAVHAHLAHLRISPDREWFRPSPDIDAFIAELESGRAILEGRETTIRDAIAGKLPALIAKKALPGACRDYLAWLARRQAASEFATQEIADLAEWCGRHIKGLDMNRRNPHPAMIRDAAKDFAKLEQMLDHDKSPVRH